MIHGHDQLGTVLRGVAVSTGIALSQGARLERSRAPVEHVHLPESLLDAEVSRLHEAVERAEGEIDRLQAALSDHEATGGEHVGILDAHKVMLRDQMLLGDAEQRIREHHLNAEWALEETRERIAELFSQMDDPFFRGRGADIHQVVEMLVRALRGESGTGGRADELPAGRVVVAQDLSPAEALQLARRPVAGFALEEGSATSHAAIIARSLGLPAVIGVAGLSEQVGDGDRIVVDGGEGEVVAHPSPEEELVYSRRAERARAFQRALRQNRRQPAVTPDGTRMVLRGNLDFYDEVEHVREAGGEGIGLFRTEFLFLDRAEPPNEEEQLEQYVRVLEAMAPHPVTIRTLDVGGDKQLGTSGDGGTPLSSSLRAIRYCLRRRDLFDTQLRALLRASAHGPLRILLPFVSSVAEVAEVRAIVAGLREELSAEGHALAPSVPLGAMIEVPASVLIADALAAEADFLSVGTNDLIQHTLAVARDDASVDYLHQPLHPAVMRMLDMVARAGRQAGVTVSTCGEMAGNPRYALVLLALGFEELSMNTRSLPLVKEVIRRTTRHEAEQLLDRIMGMTSVQAITDHTESYMVEHFPDIVSPRMRRAPRHAR